MNMSRKHSLILALAMVALAAASRLFHHPFNFTPVVAMAVFSGFYFKKWWGVAIPLAAMVASDTFIGFYELSLLLPVYVSVALAYFFGYILINKVRWPRVLITALLSSVAFFLVTNFAVWAFTPWYGHDWAGLSQCFTMALPFFRNSLVGDLVYSGAFFAIYALVTGQVWEKSKQEAGEC